MELTCNSCNTKFKLADEKLPGGRLLSLKCPKCKNKIEVDTRLGGPGGKHTPSLQAMIDEMASDTYDVALAPFEFIEEGVRTALVCERDEKILDKIRGVLEGLDYNVTEAESTRDALRYMRFHVFDLLAVNECFDGADIDSNHILQYVAHFPIITRRNIFVLLLSNEFRTGDRMMAFNKSVNLVVNVAEVDKLENFLKHAFKENEEFYAVLKESLRKLGRI